MFLFLIFAESRHGRPSGRPRGQTNGYWHRGGASESSSDQKAPTCKGRRQAGESSSFNLVKPFEKFFAERVAVEKFSAEAKAIEALKHKAPKTTVPFYYDDKTFSVSASHGFGKRLEKENWKSLVSFVKDTAASAEPMVEESTAPKVVETGFDYQES